MIEETEEVEADEATDAVEPAEIPAAPVSRMDAIKAAVEKHSATDEALEKTPEEDKAAALRGRDADGKFAKAAKVKDARETPTVERATLRPTAPVAKPPVVTPATQVTKPPAAWKLAVREDWAKVPAAVQAEILRREKEIDSGLKESSDARQLAESLKQIVSPFEAGIRANGGSPLPTIRNLLETQHALSSGTPRRKAEIAAAMIKNFDIPIDALDALLAGQAPPDGAREPQEFRDARFDKFLASMEERERTEQAAMATEARGEWEKFREANEFADDVKQDMADMMEVAARRKLTLSFDDAYARAIQLHPEIAGVMQQREAAKRAATPNGATKRARAAAASSLRSSPTPEVDTRERPARRSRADDVRAAYEKHLAEE